MKSMRPGEALLFLKQMRISQLDPKFRHEFLELASKKPRRPSNRDDENEPKGRRKRGR